MVSNTMGRARDGTAEVRSLTVSGGTVWEHFVLQLLWIMNPLGTEFLLSFLGRDWRGI